MIFTSIPKGSIGMGLRVTRLNPFLMLIDGQDLVKTECRRWEPLDLFHGEKAVPVAATRDTKGARPLKWS